MYFSDLSPIDFLPITNDNILAIGWLENVHQFEQGNCSIDFYHHLISLTNDPWQPFVSAGYHQCNICQFDGKSGTTNLFIPYKNVLYITPELITHYISCHKYLPPQIFIEACMSFEKLNGIKYYKALLNNGFRELVKENMK